MIIKQSTSAGKVIINVQNKHIGSAIRAIGTVTNDIAIEYPLISSPDVDNDTHWAAMLMDGKEVVLNNDNIAWVIAGLLGPIRVNKPAGDNVGIAHEW